MHITYATLNPTTTNNLMHGAVCNMKRKMPTQLAAYLWVVTQEVRDRGTHEVIPIQTK